MTVAPLAELRYCGEPARDASGRIKRSSAVLRAFRDVHPCPATGESRGPCPGWAIDHVIPLACGGCDAVSNLQWLPDELKSAAGVLPKDRWERKIYCRPFEAVSF
ncbi:MAG TPA: HNH endonuclease signature motif containing protein [Burkholderiales bacterium]|nr:HNH endonuclease signature motif containing protein [Burkholderiales bacterium]